MNVISYFNLISDSKFSSESEELTDVWKKSWQKHGWNTILLNESHARANPLFNKLDLDKPNANFYKTINPKMWKYHRSCYCRLLAYCQYVSENGATLYSDYDVINYNFFVRDALGISIDSHLCRSRCAVYLGTIGAKQIERAILNFSKSSFTEDAKHGSSNDMMVIKKYTDCFKLAADINNQGYVSSIKPCYTNATPLIHYDGGCYRRGFKRNMSRLDIVKAYESVLYNRT